MDEKWLERDLAGAAWFQRERRSHSQANSGALKDECMLMNKKKQQEKRLLKNKNWCIGVSEIEGDAPPISQFLADEF